MSPSKMSRNIGSQFIKWAVCLLSVFTLYSETIYIVPFRGCDVKQLFYETETLRDEIAKPFVALREALEKMGYLVQFTENGMNLSDVAAILSFEAYPELLNNIAQYPKEKCFLFNFEPPVVLPQVYDAKLSSYFSTIFVLFDDLPNAVYRKFTYPQPRLQRVQNLPDFSERKLCVMIAGNKDSAHPQSLYQERRKVIFYFEWLNRYAQIDDFDLYGIGWEGWLLWKGKVPNKWEVYKNYKFAICYENMGDQRGYITEKIFDAFIGGTVPIYLGATNISDVIPKECFIDRREFVSEEALYQFLKKMDRDTYTSYLKAIEEYLQSPKSKLFSIDHFINTIRNELE